MLNLSHLKATYQRCDCTLLWLFTFLFLCDFSLFQVCLKLSPLFPIYVDMHPGVLYTKQNLSHQTFNTYNVSLICQPIPKKSGVSKEPRTSEHPVVSRNPNESLPSTNSHLWQGRERRRARRAERSLRCRRARRLAWDRSSLRSWTRPQWRSRRWPRWRETFEGAWRKRRSMMPPEGWGGTQ